MVFNCLNTITVCENHVQQEAQKRTLHITKNENMVHKRLKAIVCITECVHVEVRLFHTLVKYMYIMRVFSSNDLNNSKFLVERMSRTHTTYY